MYIKEILVHEGDSEEAELLISDGEFEILCYAWSFSLQEYSLFSLEAFFVSDFIRTEPENYEIFLNGSSHFACTVSGKLINSNTVAVGEIFININENDVPGDIQINDFVTFNCVRLDFLQR